MEACTRNPNADTRTHTHSTCLPVLLCHRGVASYPSTSEPSRSWAVYGASKTQGEQAVWEYAKEHNPHFTVNTILPNANFGEILVPEHQRASTAGWIKAAYTGNFDKVKMIPPRECGCRGRRVEGQTGTISCSWSRPLSRSMSWLTETFIAGYDYAVGHCTKTHAQSTTST